jgi:DNA-binding XRE family transcriptional regulator
MSPGHQLRTAREALGLTRQDLAAVVGVHSATLYRWEDPGAPPPEGLAASLLAAVLDVACREDAAQLGRALRHAVRMRGSTFAVYLLLREFFSKAPA